MKTLQKILILAIAPIIFFTACGAQNGISEEDTARGWYKASFEEKKENTPDNWIWIEDGENSRWVEEITEMLDS